MGKLLSGPDLEHGKTQTAAIIRNEVSGVRVQEYEDQLEETEEL